MNQILIDSRSKKLDCNLLNQIKLTSKQTINLAYIKSFINNKDAKFIKFSGAAGTGKSTLLSQVLFWLKTEHPDINLAVASPTNKALKNIRLMANKALNTDASTYFSFFTLALILGYYLDINIYTGNDYLTKGGRTKQQKICEYDLVIIDEYSMIDERLLKDIINAVHNTQTKVLFCGDPFQLPPVKAARPPVCALDIDEITLFDVVRYDGELAIVTEDIRSHDKYQSSYYPFESSTDGTIIKYEREISWKKAAEQYFKGDGFVADKNSVRFLAYTNKLCEELSSYVRNALYGVDAAQDNPYLPNDLLIAKGPLYRKGSDDNYEQIATNSQEFLVVEPGILLADEDTGYKYWEVVAESIDVEDSTIVTLKILDKDSASDNEKNISKFQSKLQRTRDYGDKIALTKKIDSIRKAFDHVVYAYAITVHKSQGSTFERVFIDVDNIYQSNIRQKMLYTAVTRASKSINVYGNFSFDEADRIDLDTLFD